MSPAPFLERHVPAEHDADCICPPCREYREQHPPSWAPIRRVFLRSLPILVALTILGLLIVHSAQAKEGGHSLPVVVQKARVACPNTASIVECRAALRRAYAGLAWARKERARREAPYGVQHALRLASALYGVPLSQLRGVAQCESRLSPSSRNASSSAAGLFQFLDSTWARAGIPGFSVLDPYANAVAAARLVHADGSWREWSCAWAA